MLNALVADLRLLCRLHDREVDAGLLDELRRIPVKDWFSLAFSTPEATTGLDLVGQALTTLPDPADHSVLDLLAADYADIYLTFGARVAPNESYWMTEDHLERQEPMFTVRDWYSHYGLAVNDWRRRADDHLVHELEFVASLLAMPEPHARLDAARFMDRHLLAWAPAFFAGTAARAGTPFYAGLALVSLSHLQATRDLLQAITGETRCEPPPLPGDGVSKDAEEAGSYHPGAGPGW